MRTSHLLVAVCLAIGGTTRSAFGSSSDLSRRQNGNSNNKNNDLPVLGATSSSDSSSSITSTTASAGGSTTGTTTGTLSETTSVSSNSSATFSTGSSTLLTTVSETRAPTSTPTTSQVAGNSTISEPLPLTPRITPALSIGGVVLIVTGVAYAFIGVKNRWLYISLSAAYLTSLSVCVLIVYVTNPPVSNAVQGAYLVGILMTGVIFGAGALVFKEVTEGLGCLLGGFCLAMWFLTLKSGGLVENTAGKAILIAVFCALAWALSFTHITRPYALIGSTSFAGSTAFMLGVDCFSRGGLKEFWLYIWDLNPDLFPLNTSTYPITRGTRVETIVIVLGCIIGIISQVKLWKVVRDRQKERAANLEEDARRQEVVEAALGRHLERRNDRDKSEWEKQYGNLLHAKRETILWADTHREKKSYSRILESEVADLPSSSSEDNLEMSNMPQRPRSVYVARVKRSSTLAVDTITEVDEPEHYGDNLGHGGSRAIGTSRSNETLRSYVQESPQLLESSTRPISRQPEPSVTQNDVSPVAGSEGFVQRSEPREFRTLKVGSRTSFRRSEAGDYLPANIDSQSTHRLSGVGKASSSLSGIREAVQFDDRILTPQAVSMNRSQRSRSPDKTQPPAELVSGDRGSNLLAAPGKNSQKRRSWSSMFSRSTAKDHEIVEDVDRSKASVSQEALVTTPNLESRSRASSLAATLDSENEVLDLGVNSPPNIVISEVSVSDLALARNHRKLADEMPAPPALADDLDMDPEELVRSPAVPHEGHHPSSLGTENAKRRSGPDSDVGTDILFDEHHVSHTETANTSLSESLTKGTLAKVPSQLSNVVLSYRTNEWAKHASAAEAPVYEEPEALHEEILEEPAHLVTPDEAKMVTTIVEPPPLTNPAVSTTRNSTHEAAIFSPTEGVKVNPAAQFTSSPPTITPTPLVQPPLPVARPRATSEAGRNSVSNRGLRSSSTPMLVPHLVAAPIDENNVMNFVPYDVNRSASVASFNRLSGGTIAAQNRRSDGLHNGGAHPYGGVSLNAGVAPRSTSRLSLVSENGAVPGQLVSQHSNHNLLHGTRSDTRMASFDSHQPQRRDGHRENERRAALFADWRLSQQKTPAQPTYSEAHHTQRVLEKMQAKQAEEYEKSMRVQQEQQLEIAMRGRNMQEAHREAMRRLQANANEKITK